MVYGPIIFDSQTVCYTLEAVTCFNLQLACFQVCIGVLTSVLLVTLVQAGTPKPARPQREEEEEPMDAASQLSAERWATHTNRKCTAVLQMRVLHEQPLLDGSSSRQQQIYFFALLLYDRKHYFNRADAN